MKPNIALAGNMYAGKSTIADALTEHGYQRMSFAGALKNVAALAYGPVDKTGTYEITTPNGEKGEISGRQVLQRVGQSIKEHDRDFWIKCFLRDAERYEGTPLVVDDMRFVFEMQALKDAGWLIVGVDTNWQVRMERAMAISGRKPTYEELNHQSEVEIPSVIKASHVKISGTGDPYQNVAAIFEAYEHAKGQQPFENKELK